MAKWTEFHVVVFVLTFLSYAFLHAIRKTLSNVKSTLSKEWTPCTALDVNESSWTPCSPPDVWNRPASFFQDNDEAEKFLGSLDASLLFAYALGLYVSGYIADRLNLRLVLSAGMLLTGAVVFVFGPVLQWQGLYSEPAYIAITVVNGLVQSTSWPCVVACMANWFGKGSRGLVMGLWSSCASVGNIIGALMVSAVLDYGYEYAFLVNGSMLFGCGVVVFFGLVPTPLEVGLPMADDDLPNDTLPKDMQLTVQGKEGEQNGDTAGNGTLQTDDGPFKDDGNANKTDGILNSDFVNGTDEITHPISNVSNYNSTASTQAAPSAEPATGRQKFVIEEMEPDLPKTERPRPVSFLAALLLPGVIPYSLAYAFLKLVNYAFFFWLPFYLSMAFRWREATADQLSTWYDVGGIVGGAVAGFISDRCGKRGVVVVPMLLLSLPTLFLYGTLDAAADKLVNTALLTVAGFLIGGVANLIASAISADLGRQDVIRGSSEALSTVTGIVDGSGSLGAAVGQVVVPYMQVGFGWRSVFYFFMASVVVTVLCVLPILVGEVKTILRTRRRRSKCEAVVPTDWRREKRET